MDQKTGARRTVQWLAAMVSVCLIAFYAFACLFTTFEAWDDEGYFLLSYRDYLSGLAPYDRIFSFYGPYTFLAAGLSTGFDASHVTHDGFRWITLGVWIAISALFALAVFRRTANFAVALAVLLMVGVRLSGLARGVGHPQIWVIVAIAVLMCLGARWASGEAGTRRAFWVGFTACAILLMKVNIGIYVFLACALLMALQISRIRWRAIAVGIVFLISAALAAVVILERLQDRSERWFVLVYICSLAAILIAAWQRQPRAEPMRLAPVFGFSAGCLVAAIVGVGAMLASGTSLGGLWDGVLGAPLRLSRSYHLPFFRGYSYPSLALSAVAVILTAGVVAAMLHSQGRTVAVAWIKIVAGAGVMVTTWLDPGAGLCASMGLLWLVVFDAPPGSGPFLDRVFFALLAVLYSLQLYPMAGEQVNWSALIVSIVAAVTLADGIGVPGESLNTSVRLRFPAAGAMAAIAVALLFAVAAGAGGYGMWNDWKSREPVGLPGAHWLRLQPESTRRLRTIARSIEGNCKSVVMVPGLYSYVIWSGVPASEQKRVNSWPFLFGDEVVAKEINSSDASGECVLLSEGVYTFFRWLSRSYEHARPRPAIPAGMNIVMSVPDDPTITPRGLPQMNTILYRVAR